MKDHFAYVVVVLVLGVALNTNAQVYRCKTATGGTEYSQVPCGKDDQLLQSKRDSIDTTNPPADPFGVKRERDRLQMDADYYRQKSSSGTSGNSEAESTTSTAARQIDSVACDRADREALIEARHARKDSAAIRRTRKSADWVCGRDVADDRETPSTLSAKARPDPGAPPSVVDAIPFPQPERRSLTNCDASGCYDNRGARYNNMGENFMGPTGMCRKTLLGWSCP